MANLNKIFLIGNLTRDVELRSLPSGNSVAQIGLAVNREWKDKDGEKKEEVTYIDCEAWGKTGEIMAKYLQKGRPVFIEGRLKLDVFEDKESGQKRSKMKVVVESFQFLGGGEKSREGDKQPAAKAGRAAKSAGKEPPAMNPDEIPF
jgi:single-strand DNA-binding protein